MVMLTRSDAMLLLEALKGRVSRQLSSVYDYALVGNGYVAGGDTDWRVELEVEGTPMYGPFLVYLPALARAVEEGAESLLLEPDRVVGFLPHTFEALPASDFPQWPALPVKLERRLPARKLVESCLAVMHCVDAFSLNSRYPGLAFPHVWVEDGMMTAVAGDGVRLAEFRSVVARERDSVRFCLPAVAVRAARCLLEARPCERLALTLDAGGTQAASGEGAVAVDGAGWRVRARHPWWLPFPDYGHLFPPPGSLVASATVDGVMVRAVECAAKHGWEVGLHFSGTFLRVTLKKDNVIQVLHEVPARGRAWLVFNARVLGECLRAGCERGETLIFASPERKAVVLRTGDLTQLVLALRDDSMPPP